MKPTILIKPGLRFCLHGEKFEVTFLAQGAVRYAASSGGRIYKIPYDSFMDLLSENKIVINEDQKSIVITAANGGEMMRKKRYVDAAIVRLKHCMSLHELTILLPQVASEIGDGHPPCPRTVMRWVTAYRNKQEFGLLKKPNAGNCTLRFDPMIEQLLIEGIQRVYLKPERSDAKDVRAYVVGRLIESGFANIDCFKIEVPSLRTVQRRIKQLDPYVVIRAQKGDLAAQNFCRSAGRQLKSYFPLSIVQIDTHYMDVLVVDPTTGDVLGRPYLVCVFDLRTRMVVGLDISLYPASAISSLAAFKTVLVNYGIPSRMIPDNGVEIKNTAISLLCETLTIIVEPAEARDPNDKAHIESFFRTLTYGLTQKLPGTTFSNPDQRGNYDSVKKAVLTLQQVKELTEDWIANIYHRSIHTRTGRAPILDWEESTNSCLPTRLNQAEVDAIARKPFSRTIKDGKVQINYIEYFSNALAIYDGYSVTVLVDELNLHTVFVQHPKDRDSLILAESTEPEYTENLTIYLHEELKKIKKDTSARDLERLGKNFVIYARYKLLEKINDGISIGRKLRKYLTNGAGSKNIFKGQQDTVEAAYFFTEEPIVNFPNDNPSLHDSLTNFEDDSESAVYISYETFELEN